MTTPVLGAPELVAGQALPESTVNEQIRYVEQGALWFRFKDRNLATPPGSPTDGDCYLVAAAATGAWSGHDGDIAFRFGTSWNFIEPKEGMAGYVIDEDVAVNFDGTNWNSISAGSGVLTFQGEIDASGNPNYPAATKGDAYLVSVAGKVGGASGKDVNVGDLVVASADNAGGDEATVGTSWFVLAASMDGVLLAANNLSDVDDAATSRDNLGLGTAAVLDWVDEDDMVSNSAILLPTQQSVKAYVDAVEAGGARFQGGIDCSTNPDFPDATAGDYYFVDLAGKIGGVDGKTVLDGDLLFCIVDALSDSWLNVGTSWAVISAAGLYFGGIIDCSADPNYPIGIKGIIYRALNDGKIGGASGKVVADGDYIICHASNTAGGDEATVGSSWDVLPANCDLGVFRNNGLTDPNADRLPFWDDSDGALAWLTLGTGLSITGTTINASGATLADGDYGDITASSSGTVLTIDNDAVTYAKIQNVSAASKLLGRGDSGSGDLQEITLGSGLTMTGTTLSASGGSLSDGDKGDITVSASGATWTVDNGVITYAKMQDISATARILGRASSGSGDVEEVSLGGGFVFSGTSLKNIETFQVALSDMTTALTTGATKAGWVVPYDCTIVEFFIGLVAAQSSSGVVTVDANISAASIFSTNPSIDANESTSLTGAAAVLSTTALTKGQVMTFDIDAAGTGAKGLQVVISVRRT